MKINFREKIRMYISIYAYHGAYQVLHKCVFYNFYYII